MRRRFNMYVSVATLAILLNARAAVAQESLEAEIAGQPDWVILEKGRIEAEHKEYGRALFFYRAAIAGRGGAAFPEAEEMIGDVYLADNELRLAERQYRKALEQRSFLEVPEDRYRLMYKLADLFLDQERYKDYQDMLQEVAAEDRWFSDPRLDGQRMSMQRLYREQGFDAVARYYRVDALFAARAHAGLGWFLYRTGRFQEGSILHSLLAADIVLARAVEELRRVDPEYQYRDLEGLLGLARSRENVRDLLREADFYGTLYYLACASWSSGSMIRQARQIWTILSRTPEAGRYTGLAARQLQAPWTEPMINPSVREIDGAVPSSAR